MICIIFTRIEILTSQYFTSHHIASTYVTLFPFCIFSCKTDFNFFFLFSTKQTILLIVLLDQENTLFTNFQSPQRIKSAMLLEQPNGTMQTQPKPNPRTGLFPPRTFPNLFSIDFFPLIINCVLDLSNQMLFVFALILKLIDIFIPYFIDSHVVI